MGSLGDNVATGALTTVSNILPGTAVWVCTFDASKLPRDQDFEIYHGSAEGPGGFFKMYVDNKFSSAGANGTINIYDPNTALPIRKGQTITVEWSIGSGNAPTVRLWFRQPEQTGKVI
jgi:hypothetical protein